MRTPLPDFIKRYFVVKSMFNVTPFGIVRTELFCTITFAGAVALDNIVQLDVIVQSPDNGGEQGTEICAVTVSDILAVPVRLTDVGSMLCTLRAEDEESR
jgi:hypothetical protein